MVNVYFFCFKRLKKTEIMVKVTLQKYLAERAGISRRKAEKYIRDGAVKINGTLAVLGNRVETGTDKVTVEGLEIKAEEEKVYYLLNKPKGYATTTRDRNAKKKVVDLIPTKTRIWPVGRLDKESRGLLLLTNDGDFTYRLTHPKFAHSKEYEVTVNKKITAAMTDKMERGIKLTEGTARVDAWEKMADDKLKITIHQGWKRQIRRMMEKAGYEVVDLKRVAMSQWRLGNLKEGEWEEIRMDKRGGQGKNFSSADAGRNL